MLRFLAGERFGVSGALSKRGFPVSTERGEVCDDPDDGGVDVRDECEF